MRRLPAFLLLLLALLLRAGAQTNPRFNVSLSIDYDAADQTISLMDGNSISTSTLAELRGNRIAAATTSLIADRTSLTFLLQSYLDSLKYHQIIRDDVFRLEPTREGIDGIRQLYMELTRRNFGSRVVSTVEQIFPTDADVSIVVPVYVVALGHENVDAFVRRIVWHGDVPEFVGEGEGELTIVVNLAHSANYGSSVNERLVNLLGVVAHEVFHAAFGAYKDQSPAWKEYYKKHNRPIDILIDLVQNEGIAYYLSLEQQGHGALPRDWSARMQESFTSFTQKSEELLSPSVTPRRVADLLRQANLSGFWDSYGSMTGMFMAREIDRRMGRSALIETVALGPLDMLRKYNTLSRQDSNLPSLTPGLIDALGFK